MATDPSIHNGSPITGTVEAAAATNATTTTAPPPPASFTYSVNRQRIPVTIDPLSGTLPASATGPIQTLRTTGTQKIYLGIKQIQTQLPKITTILKSPVVPSPLMGQLLEPGGKPASTVQIEFEPSQAGGQGPAITAITGSDGTFTLAVPANLTFPSSGLTLKVRGADTPNPVSLAVSSGQVAPNGFVSNLKLPTAIAPLPVSIVSTLTSILSGLASSPAPNGPVVSNATIPTVTLGEDGGCQLKFQTNYSIDSFPYSIFYRLVEPQLSVSNVASTVSDPNGGKSIFYLPNYVDTQVALAAPAPAAGAAPAPSYIDRVPVEQPLSVDGFRDNIMGVNADGFIVADETVPMAGTLGLGYILTLAQKWTLNGLGLGDLVYSLPLAPGEQQQLAVFERTDTSQVVESETFNEQEAQLQTALSDTSALATFSSAVSQMQAGGSQFYTDSTNSSWGVAGGIGGILGGFIGGIGAAGGSGETTSTGNASEWLSGQLNTAQTAAQSTHSAAETQATARRTAARTGMRIASASESESITTTTVTNHNHTRSLTMQYWEVLRLYGVSSEVEGVTLTALIPLQVIRFLPPGQPLTLADTFQADFYVGSRRAVLTRYAALLKHIDVLQQAVPRQYQYGLTLLRQFASDPTAEVAQFGGAAEEVINFTLSGTFLSCERVYVSAVTRRNTRVGPVEMTGSTPTIPLNNYSSRDGLISELSTQRNGSASKLSGSLALPQTMNRNDIVGFEVTRYFIQLDYTLVSPEIQALNSLNGLFGGNSQLMTQAVESTLGPNGNFAQSTIHLTPSDLESALAGPWLTNFSATIADPNPGGSGGTPTGYETYANMSLAGVQLPQQPYPLPAEQLAPLLQYNEILEIEKTAQHVVRNTVNYSKAVWLSMTPEERAILFEGYTIGVPQGGVTDWTQMVPLLNCIENRVLGFFGNSMIVPFTIPPSATASQGSDGLTSAQVQEALFSYYQRAFIPPVSNIALPTRGVLGEAVLGHCPAAEKLDITRFWNWADAPADSAPAIASPVLPTTSPSIAAAQTAPNSLTNLPPLINNVLTAPQPNTSLLQSLATTAAAAQAVNPALTGATQLAGLITNAQNTAASARADALKTSQSLASLAMATAANLYGGSGGNNNNKPINPTAGSSALTALNTSGPPQAQNAQGNQGAQGTQPNAGTGTGVKITISPTSPSVAVGATLQLNATVTGSPNNTTVNWSVAGIAGGNSTVGTVAASGLYTAPAAVPNPAVVAVTATSQADSSQTATAALTIHA